MQRLNREAAEGALHAARTLNFLAPADVIAATNQLSGVMAADQATLEAALEAFTHVARRDLGVKD